MKKTLVTILILLGLSAAASAADDIDLLYLRASYFRTTNQPGPALKELDRAAALDSTSAQVQTSRAKVLLAMQQPELGRRALENAIRLNPEDIEPRKLLARMLLEEILQEANRKELIDRVETELKKVLEIDNQEIESLYYLELLYEKTNRTEDAIRINKRMVEINPTLVQVWIKLAGWYDMSGDRENELSALLNVVNQIDDNYELHIRTGEVAEELGQRLIANDHYSKASGILTDLIAETPDETRYHLQLARNSLWNTGAYDLAAEHYRAVIALTQEHDDNSLSQIEAEIGLATALYNMQDYFPALPLLVSNEQYITGRFQNTIPAMVITFGETGYYEKAAKVLDQLREEFKDRPGLLGTLDRLQARSLAAAGRHDEAVALLETSIGKRPAELENYLVLSSILNDMEEFDEANAVLDNAASHADADDTDILFSRAVILDRQDRKDESIELLKTIIKKDPENDLALNFLGYTLAEQDRDLELAADTVESALKLRPNQGSYQDSLGWIYYKMDDLQSAERMVEQAVKTSYKSAEVREHLGYIYYARKKYREALAEFEAALDNGLADLKPIDDVEAAMQQIRDILGTDK